MIAMTAIDMMPTPEELAQMKAGTYKQRKLEQAYGDYHDGWNGCSWHLHR